MNIIISYTYSSKHSLYSTIALVRKYQRGGTDANSHFDLIGVVELKKDVDRV